MGTITSALCNAAKRDFLAGVHKATDTYKIALIKPAPTGTFGAATTSYTQLLTDEVVGTGYTTGGLELQGHTVGLDGAVGYLDFDNAEWPAPTAISAAGAIIYNDSAPGKEALAVFSFNGTVTSTNDMFTVEIPVAGLGIIRFA